MTTDPKTAGPSATLARFAAGLDYADIPKAAVDRIKLCLLDAVGCGVFATALPWGRILGRYVADMGGVEDAVMWGARKRVPTANAALRSEEHTSELQSLMRISYAVFCLK